VANDLRVEKLSLTDTGYYQCVASNKYGVKSRTYFLQVVLKGTCLVIVTPGSRWL